MCIPCVDGECDDRNKTNDEGRHDSLSTYQGEFNEWWTHLFKSELVSLSDELLKPRQMMEQTDENEAKQKHPSKLANQQLQVFAFHLTPLLQ